MVVNRKSSLRCRDAADERQYMLSGDYDVYSEDFSGGFFPKSGAVFQFVFESFLLLGETGSLGGLLGGFRRLLLLIADSFRVFLPLVQSCLCLLLLTVTVGVGSGADLGVQGLLYVSSACASFLVLGIIIVFQFNLAACGEKND